jgi:isopentenyl-diphosphate Delta-isomerase
MQEENIILVDEQDEEIGVGEKMQVHREGRLHRSFSIFIFNSKDELLLQQRAKTKYHSGGLWSNACCGHPRPGEETIQAGRRRLQEEFGFDCKLTEVLQFTYKVKLDNNLWEHEFDHTLKGLYNGEVRPNPVEIMDYKWISKQDLFQDLKNNPSLYTEWFKIALGRAPEIW